MGKNSKWYIAGILLIGVAIGIVFVGSLTSVVHWAGTNKFCGEFCHSMDLTYAAYKKGQHFQTASGATAGCSDCHLLNHSNPHVGPVDYTMLLLDKARAGTNSLIGEIQGSLSTPEKQLEKRKEMSEAVHKQMIERNFSACRGCHDISRMHNPKKPFIAKLHQNLDKDPKKPMDCLACHPKAGHDYAAADAELAKAKGEAKPEAKAEPVAAK